MEHEEVPWEHILIIDRLDSVLLTCSAHYNFASRHSQTPLLRMLRIQIPEASHRLVQPKTKKIGTPPQISPVAAFANKGVLKNVLRNIEVEK